MKGLEFFKSKAGNKTFDKVEEVIGFELPNYFKFFTSLYELGSNKILSHKYLNSKFKSVSDCGLVVFKPSQNEEYGFDGFFDENELINDWESYSIDSHEFLEYGLVRIANIGIGGGVFIGTKDEKRDKIYLVNWSKDEDYYLIADNIFEFSKSLIFKEEDSFIPQNSSYSQLYKNWGEDFWRVKE
ncbi:hypothetical protein [Algibacter sp. 2305UL17-15]|uniref:hypothetical protein n=1 Tax=Algibacter sp. 2305UL17-15 TaxID=3231268 RepID=UPI00345911DF